VQGTFQLFLGNEHERAEDALGYMNFVMYHGLTRTVLFGNNGEIDASSYLDRADFVKHVRYEQIEMHD
jgi:hypothetical protein